MILVCGMPRSGTSAVMQMCKRAGLDCAGHWPWFEDARYIGLPRYPYWMDDYSVIKIHRPHVHKPPPFCAHTRYHVVWCWRDFVHQAESIIKFQRDVLHNPPSLLDPLVEYLRLETERGVDFVRSLQPVTYLDCNFRQLVTDPTPIAQWIANAWRIETDQNLDVDHMVRSIRKRSELPEHDIGDFA